MYLQERESPTKVGFLNVTYLFKTPFLQLKLLL